MGTLYIVATPIGNRKDITLRALEVLSSVQVILCEDTRTTAKLLKFHHIDTKTESYHTHSEDSRLENIVTRLTLGEDMALVSDAGTPTISDPGSRLVSEARLAGVRIEPIPGASAVVTALSGAGVPASEFLFLGFLPHKKGRQTLFKEIAGSKRTVVFYESPHRILKAMRSLIEFAPEKKVTIARELTKIYEEFIVGSPQEVLDILESDTNHQKGEFVVIVSWVVL